MKKDKVLKNHVFVFNENDNGGEHLSLTTNFITNGDPITDKEGIYLNQMLLLQSYGNSACFEMSGAILTPEKLRQLADELERERKLLKHFEKNKNVS